MCERWSQDELGRLIDAYSDSEATQDSVVEYVGRSWFACQTKASQLGLSFRHGHHLEGRGVHSRSAKERVLCTNFAARHKSKEDKDRFRGKLEQWGRAVSGDLVRNTSITGLIMQNKGEMISGTNPDYGVLIDEDSQQIEEAWVKLRSCKRTLRQAFVLRAEYCQPGNREEKRRRLLFANANEYEQCLYRAEDSLMGLL